MKLKIIYFWVFFCGGGGGVHLLLVPGDSILSVVSSLCKSYLIIEIKYKKTETVGWPCPSFSDNRTPCPRKDMLSSVTSSLWRNINPPARTRRPADETSSHDVTTVSPRSRPEDVSHPHNASHQTWMTSPEQRHHLTHERTDLLGGIPTPRGVRPTLPRWCSASKRHPGISERHRSDSWHQWTSSSDWPEDLQSIIIPHLHQGRGINDARGCLAACICFADTTTAIANAFSFTAGSKALLDRQPCVVQTWTELMCAKFNLITISGRRLSSDWSVTFRASFLPLCKFRLNWRWTFFITDYPVNIVCIV